MLTSNGASGAKILSSRPIIVPISRFAIAVRKRRNWLVIKMVMPGPSGWIEMIPLIPVIGKTKTVLTPTLSVKHHMLSRYLLQAVDKKINFLKIN